MKHLENLFAAIGGNAGTRVADFDPTLAAFHPAGRHDSALVAFLERLDGVEQNVPEDLAQRNGIGKRGARAFALEAILHVALPHVGFE
jgi:hypothetical protein